MRKWLIVLFIVSLSTSAYASNDALEFDGVDDYVLVPASDSFNFGNGDFTIEFSVKFHGLSEQYITSQASDIGFHANQILYNLPNDAINFNVVNGAAGQISVYSSPNSVTTDTWYHIAAVRNGNNWSIYRNSDLIGNVNAPATAANLSAPLYIGACWLPHPYWPIPKYYLDGELDEFRVWKTARTVEELEYWKDRSLSGNEENLFAYYNFDEVYEGIVPDLTSYNNDGQTHGMPIIPTPIPEPATMILFGLGGLATAFIKRRCKA